MKNKLASLTATIFLLPFISCSSDDALETQTSTCKIVKYNKDLSYDSKYNYDAEFVYKNNRMIKRKNYGNILPAETGFIKYGVVSEDSIVYDKNNNVEKIINLESRISNDGISIYKIERKYDNFFYSGNSKKPYKRESFTIEIDGKVSSKWIETMRYDSKNRIIQTDGYSEARPEYRTIQTKFIYDTNGNLEEYSQIEIYNKSQRGTVDKYSNYDTNKNPFKNITVQFVEYRNLSYSNNNYRTHTSEKIDSEVKDTGISIWQIDSFVYNENGYPLFAELECN